MRILIAGGYGVFGGRLAQLLADEPRLTLIIAGRSPAKAMAFCRSLTGLAKIEPAVFDRDGDLEASFDALKPDVIVDASGPFQAYAHNGHDPYRLMRAAIDRGIPYFNLADGADFVAGAAQFDAAAKAKGIAVLSGVSSFPVLTAAVVRHLSADGLKVESITGGIAPSPYAGVGENVIRAITSYAGQPVKLTRSGKPAVAIGLVETRDITIAPPGYLPLRHTRFSLVDVPDLQMLSLEHPGLQDIWIGAGTVPEILHRGLKVLSRLVSWGLLPSLSPFAGLFHWVVNTVRWGEHRGGMFVAVRGRLLDGAVIERSWHMVAEGDHGPFIPAMAIAALIRKMLDGHAPAPGARSAVRALEIADYERLFAGRAIHWGPREAPDPTWPLYRRVLGTAWAHLPLPVRTLHDMTTDMTADGTATVERGTSLAARMIATLFRFPRTGTNVPVQVNFKVKAGVETWTRTFAGRQMVSRQEAGQGRNQHLIVERFGPFAFGLAPILLEGRLHLVGRTWSLFGVPLPAILVPNGIASERDEAGRFHFDVHIAAPLVGSIVHYRGWLVPRGVASATALMTDDAKATSHV